MTELNAINRKGVIDLLYVAELGDRKLLVWAASLAQAKQRSIERFRPKKKELPNLTVRLL